MLELSGFVESDLESIADFIAVHNPERAVSFLRELQEAIKKVGRNPLRYRLRPDIGEHARLAVFGRYVILFLADPDSGDVRIERVVFGGRNLPELLAKS